MSGRKVLVIRGGALGDFVLTLPVLAALRRQFPDHSVEILGYPHIASLAVAAGLASRVLVLESPALAGFFVDNGSWPASSAAFFAQFDLIVSYLYDPDGVFRRNVARVASARFLAAPHRPDETSSLRATEFFLKPLASLGIEGADPCPRIILPAGAPFSAGRWIALHPGSGSERKNWPEAKWAELLPRLARHHPWNFFLINGEAEGGRGRRLSALLPAHRVCLANNLPLLELAQKMKSCAAFIGHDSGITHLAAALDLPGLVLWGPSSAAIWQPCSVKMRLLSQSTVTADQIEEELRQILTVFAK
jgi:ADP-heptose:LPS heptosyltransferase